MQRQQLEDALAFYQGTLAELDQADEAVREDAADAYHATARIQHLLRRREQALLNFRHAVDLWSQLAEEFPGCALPPS